MNIIDPDNWLNTITDIVRCHNIPEECSGKLLVDVGANIGGYINYIGHKFEKIVAIEACKKNVDILEKNIEKFSNKNIEILHRAAFSSSEKELKLKYHICDGNINYFGNSGNPSLSEHYDEKRQWGWNEKNGYELVNSIDLTTIHQLYGNITLIKIDIEGGEEDFIMNQDLTKIKYIDIEYHLDLEKKLDPYIRKTHDKISPVLYKIKE